MKPIIGISTVSEPAEDARSGGNIHLNWNYAQSIVDAGGVPVLIPANADPEAVLPLLDGILIPGGDDIDAANWGEENHPKVSPVSKVRFDSERRLLGAVDPEMPVLGICYGCQLLNVMRGGSLIQHLPDVETAENHERGVLQEYVVDPHSKLADILGKRVAKGESWHHQAIKDVGKGLHVVAKSEDETVEAVEADDRPWTIGVQWHPERSMKDQENMRLFERFVQAAKAYKENKGADAVP
jgi:putative glutamine amidotransferase